MGDKVSNMEISKKEGHVTVTVNPRIYPLDVVYSAAYTFLDKAYVLIDGDPQKELKVELKPKGDCSLENLGREFNNELLNYAFFKKRADENKEVRTAIIQRALLTNDPSVVEEFLDEDADDEEYLEDPKGIAVPWEEKYQKSEDAPD